MNDRERIALLELEVRALREDVDQLAALVRDLLGARARLHDVRTIIEEAPPPVHLVARGEKY
jgi:hypothetical protein